MKKTAALILAVCMAFTVLSATAEGLEGLLDMFSSSGESAEESENTQGAGGVLNEIMGLFDSSGESADETESTQGAGEILNEILGLFDSSGESADETGGSENNGLDLNGLLSLLGGIAGNGDSQGLDLSGLLSKAGTGSSGDLNLVAAESAEAFYGTWMLDRLLVGGVGIPAELLKSFGLDPVPMGTLSAETVELRLNDGDPVTKRIVSAELSNGALKLALDTIEATLQMTENGEVLLTVPAGYAGLNMELKAVLTSVK